MGKKNQPQRQPRTEYIYGTTVSEASELIVSVDSVTGDLTFGNEMTNTYSEVSYERTKSPKVVSRIPQVNDGLTFDPDMALLKNYDFLCAVDTNTRTINGKKVSVVGILVFREAASTNSAQPGGYWKFDIPFCLEFISVRTDKPENFGWVAALQQLHDSGYIRKGMRVGVVVDSDLGNINDYNHGRKPVFETFILPKNVRLIYASSDTGKDSVVNHALSIADSVSSQALKAVESGLTPFNEERVNSPWHEGVRIIVPNGQRS